MRHATVARRYARALYALAVESKSLDDVLLGLGNVRLALETTPQLRQILFNPAIKPESKRKLIAAVTSNKLVGKFLDLLAKRKRLDLISGIYDQLSELSDLSKGILRPIIKTAVPLSDDQKRSIEKQLAKTVGGDVIARFDVAKELIGGVWIKLGDKVLDASLRGKLDDFRHALLHSAN